MKNLIVTHRWLCIILCLAAFLRLYKVNEIPASLYWDEASLGYNAFSILKAGIDEHGVSFPITHFLAYGDAKPPGYIYAIVPFMAVFGVNALSIRLPSAIAGIVAVLITYYLGTYVSKALFKKRYPQLGLVVALILSISPWHIQLSRAAFEANLALTLFLAGMLAFFYALKQPTYYVITAITWVLTWYTFNAYRIFLPPLILMLGVLYFKNIVNNLKFTIPSFFLALAMTLPLLPFVFSDQARLRFDEVTIFKDHNPVIDANTRQELNNNALWSKLLYNRRVLFSIEFLDGYFDHLKPEFLFMSGDVNARLSVIDMGELYFIELPLLLIGLYLFARTQGKIKWVLIAWALFAIIPAAVARETPHALRSLQLVPLPQLLVAIGIVHVIELKKWKYGLVIAYLISFGYYLNLYYRHYRAFWADSWQYGYEELVDYLKEVQDNYDRIYVTNALGRQYTYLLLFLEYDPREYVANRDAGGDAFGFTETYSFDKYYFTESETAPEGERWLYVGTQNDTLSGTSPIKTIYNLKNDPVFVIYE